MRHINYAVVCEWKNDAERHNLAGSLFNWLEKNNRHVLSTTVTPHTLTRNGFLQAEDYEKDYMVFSLLCLAAKACGEGQKQCDILLSPQLIGKEGTRIYVQLGNYMTTEFWVDRTNSWMPYHILKSRKNGVDYIVVKPDIHLKIVE